MSDDDDLFGSSGSDGGDTDDLIATAKSNEKAAPIAKKKKRLQKKGSASSKKRKRDPIPDADLDSDDDDGKGLFDDSDDEEEPAKPKASLSRKERMEALQAKKRQESTSGKKKSKRKKGTAEDGDEKGYDSGDSYNSAEYVRTKEDNDFIDVDDDDPDAINELYAEQHFDDERPLGSDDEDQQRKKKKSTGSSRGRRAKGPDAVSDNEDDDNPIMAAVRKMKRKKKTALTFQELSPVADEFLSKLDAAAEDDEKAVAERTPATRKLVMLNEVLDMLARQDIIRILLDKNLLVYLKRWIQPLPNGALGNITVRQRILDAVGRMRGEETGVTSEDLKESGFGKVVMTLYMHKDETPSMKRQLKNLIEQWSRPIFRKENDLRFRSNEGRGDRGLVGINRVQQQQQQAAEAVAKGRSQKRQQDLHTIISTGTKGARDIGGNRVQIPFSKGMHYTQAPRSRTGNVMDKRLMPGSSKGNRTNLNKRMIEKGRAASKNQRSANISIEGRPSK